MNIIFGRTRQRLVNTKYAGIDLHNLRNFLLKAPFSRNCYSYPVIGKFFSEKMKINIKGKISLVESDSVVNENEEWAELLCSNISKEHLNKFFDGVTTISKKNIILTTSDINKILSACYIKNIKAVDTIYNYICDKNIPLDSIAYYYLISANLQFKNFSAAFELFNQASILGVTHNLSVLISLCKEANNHSNEEEKIRFVGIIVEHAKKNYGEDVIELIDSLVETKDSLWEEDGESKKFKKTLKKKKETDKRLKKPEDFTEKKEKDPEQNLQENKPLETENKSEPNLEKQSNNEEIKFEQPNPQEIIQMAKEIIKERENENSSNTSDNVVSKKKKKDKKNKKSQNENALDSFFGNGGVIVVAQSFHYNENESVCYI